jgi:hypothetical protein
MKIKFSTLHKALDHARYKAGASTDEHAIIDVELREEDLETNKLGSCMVITFTKTYNPDNYDSVTSKTTKEYTLEVFADHENRVPRLTVVESRDLEFKK